MRWGIAEHRWLGVEIVGHYRLPRPFRGEGRGEGAVSRGRPIVRKVLTAPLPTLSPEGERAISIGQFQYPLGDDVELDLARPALDRIGLGAQPLACRRATRRGLAFPFERVRSARRQDRKSVG